MSRDLLRYVGRGGIAAAIALPTVMLVLTLTQLDYLDAQSWSPIGRTPTQWPSILATGPGGWLMSVTFALSAVLTLALGVAVWRIALDLRGRVLGALVVAVAIGLTGVSFPADQPTGPTTWHAAVHNSLYPLIPLATILAALLCAVLPPRGLVAGSPLVAASRLLAPLMVVFSVATSIDPIAQGARYFAFSAFLVWLGLLSGRLSKVDVDDGSDA